MPYEKLVADSKRATTALKQPETLSLDGIAHAIDTLALVSDQIVQIYQLRTRRIPKETIKPLMMAQTALARQLILLRNAGLKAPHGWLSPVVSLEQEGVGISYTGYYRDQHYATVPFPSVITNRTSYKRFTSAVNAQSEIPPSILK